MSIIGEYRSATTASQLEVVLLEAIGRGGKVKQFAKECLYDWYLGECEDSYGIHKPDPEIIKQYSNEVIPDETKVIKLRGRIIREGTIGTCPECGSTEVKKYGFFGKSIGCINPDCGNYYKK